MSKQILKITRRAFFCVLAAALAGCANISMSSVSPPVQPLPAPGNPSPASCPAGGTCCSVVAFRNGTGGFLEPAGTDYVSLTLTNSTTGTNYIEPSSQYGFAVCDISASPPTFLCAPISDTNHVSFVGTTNHIYVFDVFFECPAPSPTNWSGVILNVTH
jgi:hypothetical protein